MNEEIIDVFYRTGIGIVNSIEKIGERSFVAEVDKYSECRRELDNGEEISTIQVGDSVELINVNGIIFNGIVVKDELFVMKVEFCVEEWNQSIIPVVGLPIRM